MMSMKIEINGNEHIIEDPLLSYEDILRLAEQPMGATVVYCGPRRGDAQRTGTLCRGKTVTCEDGMIFDAIRTGNA
jgi:hypothetical protein